MKQLFLAIAIATFSFAAAQDKLTFWVKPVEPKTNFSLVPDTVAPYDQVIANAQFLKTLPNGNKLYALPQDNMPCIVPEMSEYNYNMPVLKPNVTYIIPNAANPPAKPQAMTPDQLNKFLEKYKKIN